VPGKVARLITQESKRRLGYSSTVTLSPKVAVRIGLFVASLAIVLAFGSRSIAGAAPNTVGAAPIAVAITTAPPIVQIHPVIAAPTTVTTSAITVTGVAAPAPTPRPSPTPVPPTTVTTSTITVTGVAAPTPTARSK
jgi:hypothetical protein